MTSENSKTSYIIKYEDIYDGPVDLLVELIRKKKINIYDISISYIIEGFSDYISKVDEAILETLSSFIYFASILLEIKSRSLLPSQKSESDEGELDINILKRREEEYRIYKKVSNYIDSKILKSDLFFIREAPLEKSLISILPDFMEELDAVQIWSIAGRLFLNMDIETELKHIYDSRSTIKMAEEMERVRSVLSERKEVTFREISSVYDMVIDRIISFLSLLELYKNDEIEILQFESFGNIIIRSK